MICPQDFYLKHLKTINGINFTPREIDIIACFINGRSTKKTAALLSIVPKTVEYHANNIMQKVRCNYREGVIDFIEKSLQARLLREYYTVLLNQIALEDVLKTIPSLIKEEPPQCLILSSGQPHIQQLADHLLLASISVALEVQKEPGAFEPFFAEQNKYSLILLAPLQWTEEILKTVASLKGSHNILFLLSEEQSIDDIRKRSSLEAQQWLDFHDYYSSVFSILKTILSSLDIESIQAEFNNQCKEVSHPVEAALEPISQNATSSFIRNRSIWASILGLVLLISAGCLFLYKKSSPQEESFVRSDMVVPTAHNCLERPELLTKIEEGLNKKQGIQTIALTGVGGAGKTTLARHYAKQQKGFVWEINAETHLSLVNSFEKMAYALCQTEEDRKLLKSLQEIKNHTEREEKILLFAKNKLKSVSSWILIYDNTEQIADIQQYIPFDESGWGQGKVLLTTRDSHTQHNPHVHHTIYIGELSAKEKLDFFINIMTNGQPSIFDAKQQKEAGKFLEKIPSFPLDVSVAAYYLKATHISYEKYLEKLKKCSEEFESMQANLLKETGTYTKTRYSIISLSASRLIEAHKDFGELMLLISLIDSQNIPRDLLEAYKKSDVVDNFIYYLKLYSLLTNETSLIPGASPSFSMHHSTQEMSLNYLTHTLHLVKNHALLQEITNVMEEYLRNIIVSEDFARMNCMLNHGSAFLKHQDLLGPDLKEGVGIQLGYLYFYLHHAVEGKKLLETSFSNLDRTSPQNHEREADALMYLGIVYADLGDYPKAKNFLNESIKVFKNHLGSPVRISVTLGTLAIIHNEMGNYKEAKDLLEQTFANYHQYVSQNYAVLGQYYQHLSTAYRGLGEYAQARNLLQQSLSLYQENFTQHMKAPIILGHLAFVDHELGYNEKARNQLEKSLQLYTQKFSQDDEYVMLGYAYLGNIYKNLKDYTKAQQCLEQSLALCQKQFPDNHSWCARPLAYLGDVYRLQGKADKALPLLQQALAICEKHYGPDHVETARVMVMLAQAHLAQGKIEAAESLLQKALTIMEKSGHPDVYIVLEGLSDLCLKQAINSKDQQAQALRKKARGYLQQAHETLKKHFPLDSPYLIAVELKSKALQVEV